LIEPAHDASRVHVRDDKSSAFVVVGGDDLEAHSLGREGAGKLGPGVVPVGLLVMIRILISVALMLGLRLHGMSSWGLMRKKKGLES
jgi:hypothetical protein